MFNKKFTIFGAFIIYVISLCCFLIVPPTNTVDSVQAANGYQWIQGEAYIVLQDSYNLSGDNLDTAVAQYESNSGQTTGTGTYLIGFDCKDDKTLSDDSTPECKDYYYFVKERGVNPPFFHNFCELSDACGGEAESISLASFTRGCHNFSFAGSGTCTTGVTINKDPFNIRKTDVQAEYGIDFSNIDRIIQDDIDAAPTTEDPGGDPIVDDPAAETDDSPRCEESFDFPGAWIVCLVLTTISGTVDKMVDAIADMLSVGRAEINDDGLKAAWSYFRNIASVLLVVIGLVMIIGQAVSKE